MLKRLGFALIVLMGQYCWAKQPTRLIAARDLATLNDISGLSLSPDRQWVAFEIAQADPGGNQYDAAWYVMRIDAQTAHRVADAGDLMFSVQHGRIIESLPSPAPFWSADGRWLIYLRRDNNSTQIWRTPTNGGDSQQLTHNAGDVRAMVYARDGSRLLFETEPSKKQIDAALAAEGLTGFLYDKRFQPVYARTPVFPADAVLMGEGARQSQSHRTSLRYWTYDLSSGREQPATQKEAAEFAALTAPPRPEGRPAFRAHYAASTHGARAWTEALDPQRQGQFAPLTVVAQLSAGAKPVVCTASACTASSIAGLWWRNNEELVFLSREGPGQQDRKLYAWRPRQDRPPRLLYQSANFFAAAYPGCVITSSELLCLYEHPDYPRRLTALNLDDGRLRTLYDPNPGFARFDLGSSPQRLIIRADSGAETFGYLVLPPNRSTEERLPLVVVSYRCNGFLRGGTGDEYPVYPFAAQGFAVLCYSLPDDFERGMRLDEQALSAWERGPGSPLRRRVEDTLLVAVKQLDERGLIDPERVGITGLSFGAEIVGIALPLMPRLAATIASSHPGTGPGNYALLGPLIRDLRRAQGLGAPHETPQRWDELSFTARIPQVRAPLLINVSDHEMLAALHPVTALQDAGRAVEMFVYPDEYHIKWQAAHRLVIYNRNIDWMNFWLRGVESNLSNNPEQYVRWRAMRVQQCELFTGGDDTPWYC